MQSTATENAEEILPSVEYFLSEMGNRPNGIFDVRELEENESLWPSEIRTQHAAFEAIARLNFAEMQFLLWALAPPQGLDTPLSQQRLKGMQKRLEHVWKKRGQHSVLQLQYNDFGLLVGSQSHGMTMALDALQPIISQFSSPNADPAESSDIGSSYLDDIISVDSQEVFCSSLLESLLASGPLIDRTLSLGRATTIIHPFLIAWVQQNIIVNQIDQGMLRILLSNFQALTDNIMMREQLGREAPNSGHFINGLWRSFLWCRT